MRKTQSWLNHRLLGWFLSLLVFAFTFFSCGDSSSVKEADETESGLTAASDNGSITLPDGFAATIVADNLGGARHIVVNENGDIYIKMSNTENGGGVVALRDTTGDGQADIKEYFTDYGGTGIGLYHGYLYFSSDTVVYRVKLNEGELVPTAEPEVIVEGFLPQGPHESKPITFDNSGHMYVTVGAPSNACQEKDRTPGMAGQDPCPELERQAGIWRFDAEKPNQTQVEDGHLYGTGIRNAVAIAWNDQVNELYALQHGRDQLATLWPEYFNDSLSAELPAEEFLQVKDGSDFGWPYCYYDQNKEAKILAPEYGGNGEEVGRCENVDTPIMAFPAHWAPNGLVFYEGNLFPEKYQNGAFIAFHGSWNRAPLEQKGYLIAFVPFQNSQPSGEYERFADQFAGSGEAIEQPNNAEFRPVGVAVGPDGSLYITDDQKGRVWRVFYENSQVALQ